MTLAHVPASSDIPVSLLDGFLCLVLAAQHHEAPKACTSFCGFGNKTRGRGILPHRLVPWRHWIKLGWLHRERQLSGLICETGREMLSRLPSEKQTPWKEKCRVCTGQDEQDPTGAESLETPPLMSPHVGVLCRTLSLGKALPAPLKPL